MKASQVIHILNGEAVGTQPGAKKILIGSTVKLKKKRANEENETDRSNPVLDVIHVCHMRSKVITQRFLIVSTCRDQKQHNVKMCKQRRGRRRKKPKNR